MRRPTRPIRGPRPPRQCIALPPQYLVVARGPRVNELERECESLRRENGWLKGLVVGVSVPRKLPSNLPPP
ncbi:hypothetical protein FB451DRAFT_1253392 [Mycena latifolia]|nr:hypothetical protein FB451DRAFT_1253392 [Mycena latifolia]